MSVQELQQQHAAAAEESAAEAAATATAAEPEAVQNINSPGGPSVDTISTGGSPPREPDGTPPAATTTPATPTARAGASEAGSAAAGEAKGEAVASRTYARTSREFGRLGDCFTPSEMVAVVRAGMSSLAEDAARISVRALR